MKSSVGQVLAIAALSVMALTGQAEARDQIRIVGSSTVFPFATVVADNFSAATHYKTPVVESTGSVGGLKLFCQGVGDAYPDIANASRRIKRPEVETCARNGVTDITEVKIGFDGIVFANSKDAPRFTLTREQIFLALARQVPVDGRLVDNPYTNWSQIDGTLPDEAIEVIGPPLTSGTRDSLIDLVMEHAAEQIPFLAALRTTDKDGFRRVYASLREDGRYVEAGENDTEIVRRLEANPTAVGIFGFSYLDQNADWIQGAMIEGIAPTFATIADGAYPVSRPLFFYVKNAQVDAVPGIKDYIAEFTAAKAIGTDGYLVDKGLIPLPEADRRKYEAAGAMLSRLVL